MVRDDVRGRLRICAVDLRAAGAARFLPGFAGSGPGPDLLLCLWRDAGRPAQLIRKRRMADYIAETLTVDDVDRRVEKGPAVLYLAELVSDAVHVRWVSDSF